VGATWRGWDEIYIRYMSCQESLLNYRYAVSEAFNLRAIIRPNARAWGDEVALRVRAFVMIYHCVDQRSAIRDLVQGVFRYRYVIYSVYRMQENDEYRHPRQHSC
jgi:hypothetical protein